MEIVDVEFKEVVGTEFFNFEVDKPLVGVMNELVPGKYGHDNYELEVDSNTKVTIKSTTVLHTKLAKVKIGDMVRITYLGKVQSATGNTYHDYKVEVAGE